ncbi:hypothetical protein QSV34_11685 [Porticoccus sp. W117]|uniref:hypothetical protein n=1 Tax=Porticoccus sp. W117 TaxID=3054777 RepID=UPI00259A72C1|nr:hypothetical protein [Porticoccus sp. W117]MDM3872008.1 hypothetical protein [Porticoccus sp. W117]
MPEGSSGDGGSKYKIPNGYDPEPSSWGSNAKFTIVDSGEFSLMLTGEILAKNIQGFDPTLNGRSHDTMVIVNVYDPTIHDGWEPPEHIVKNWDDMWKMEGNYKDACIGRKKDNLTGYYRYYMSCHPDPHPNSNFFLIDRIPELNKPRPKNQEYIKGNCTIVNGFIRPEEGRYHSCHFFRYTKSKDRYSFRLYGKNVRLLNEVENFLDGRFTEWLVSSE